MKKIITSASLAALGVVSLQAANTTGLTATEQTKWWSASLSLRGFYDDNLPTLNAHRIDGVKPVGTFGFGVSPSVSVNLVGEQTLFNAGYIYGLKYYENSGVNNGGTHGPIDQSHQANVKLNHAFTEDYKLDVSDRFVIAQEAELLNRPGIQPGFSRTAGQNLSNLGDINLRGKIFPNWDFAVDYSNFLVQYNDRTAKPYTDRMEHLVQLDTQYVAVPGRIIHFTYQFGLTDQSLQESQFRNSRSHYVFLGIDQILPNFSLFARAGARYTEYPDAGSAQIAGLDSSSNWTPYVDVGADVPFFLFGYKDLWKIGIKHDRSQVYLQAVDQEATSVYTTLDIKLMERVTANLNGRYQMGSVNQLWTGTGFSNSYSENWFSMGLNLGYQFDSFSIVKDPRVEVGYLFDRLDSDINTASFSRNQIYLGVRGSF